MNKHLDAILKGAVTKTNVIGLRKGLSVSRTCPKLSGYEVDQTLSALKNLEPRVVGELHDSGVRLLRNKRHAKRLAHVMAVVNSPNLHFRLVGFERIGWGCTPVYRAASGAVATDANSFLFYNVPWQSGGDGPQIIC
jgi:hypothetical protein